VELLMSKQMQAEVSGPTHFLVSNGTKPASAIGYAGPAAGRTLMGVGTMGTQAADNVSITGGSITGLTALSLGANATITTPNTLQYSLQVDLETTAAGQEIFTFDALTYRFAKVLATITAGSDYQMTEINLLHDGTVAKVTEYGSIASDIILSTFTADVVGGTVRLLASPTQINTTYRLAIMSILA
jgi:hypothetical protein